jgi:hypothetical protein
MNVNASSAFGGRSHASRNHSAGILHFRQLRICNGEGCAAADDAVGS